MLGTKGVRHHQAFLLLLSRTVCACVHVCAYHGMYLEIRGQLAGVKFVPSTMGIPGNELRLSDVVTSTFTSGGRREVTPLSCLPFSIHTP